MRKVFLENLPRWEKGEGKGKIGTINWSKSIGSKVRFVYEDIEGEVEIVGYDGKHLIIKYLNGMKFHILTDSFMSCKLGKLLGRITKEFKYKIGELIKDDKRDLIITDRDYRIISKLNGKHENQKWYKYTCNICGWTEGWIIEGNLIGSKSRKPHGCLCCSNQTTVLGINTIWDKARWMCDLGISEEDAKTHTKASHDRVLVECPDCKKERYIDISDIYTNKSISCKSCGDGFSYPEKFMMSVLNQLGISFIPQLNKAIFEWCEKYRYDFYLPNYNMIIETHGIQHYKYTGRGRSLEEEKENDKVKKESALESGVNEYIVVDCRNSNMEWIKNSILNSKLNELFDLSKVNWLKCEEFALGNLVKEVCDYWNNKEEWETTQTIANNNPWGIKNICSIIKYLKKGTKLGWCNYDSKEEMRKNGLKLGERNRKPIGVYKNGKFLYLFLSVKDLEECSLKIFGVKLNQGNISSVCLGKRKQYKGFTFKYI